MEPAEIQRAIATVRKERRLPGSVRFVTVTLNEPPKDAVLHPRADGACPREASPFIDISLAIGGSG